MNSTGSRGDLERIDAFFAQIDENGITNREKVQRYQHIIRRVETTAKDRSYEDSDTVSDGGRFPSGVVTEGGKLIGFGIHIYNEDVYPLKSFEIYFRNCDLVGALDLSHQQDLVFIDLYHNRIEAIALEDLPGLRILGVQDNCLQALDPTGLPACQGIDAGRNRLGSIDVSQNLNLAELYVNDNELRELDLSHNPELKYCYCHNNQIRELDALANPQLRHLNASGNPMKRIRCRAPQREECLPLTLTAGEGGTVGMQFNPIYNAQWKETGEWQQTYYAYPEEDYRFAGWYENGVCIFEDAVLEDEYGASRELVAKFKRI